MPGPGVEQWLGWPSERMSVWRTGREEPTDESRCDWIVIPDMKLTAFPSAREEQLEVWGGDEKNLTF